MKAKYIIYFLSKDKKNIPESPTKRFSIAGYNKVIQKVLNKFPQNYNVKESDIKSLGLTNYMTNKILDYFKLKIPKVAEKEIIKASLVNIIGIGDKKADELINAGITNINQLKNKKYNELLNSDSKIVAKYKPLKKIPHQIIKELEETIIKFPKTILVGSYRRKKEFSKDIDVMIVSNYKILEKFVEYLKKLFTIHVYSMGEDKMSILLLYKKKYVKLDVFRTHPSEKYAMLLYSTGSKQFNIKMRAKAKKMGYLLNQKGLFKNNKKIIIKSEKEFFKILKMDYVEPHLR